MRRELVDITVVMDRSGSMRSCRDEAESGLNHFVSEQKEIDGHAIFTLVQFDTHYEFVHAGVDIRSVGKCTLIPRGMTALLDAVGRAINETGERLKDTPKDQRPGLVVFVILTDGLENSSHEFTLPQIKEMIEHQQSHYQWQFTFLGANQDAFAAGRGMGIPAEAVANYSEEKTSGAIQAASANVGRMRLATSRGMRVSNSYSDAERNGVL